MSASKDEEGGEVQFFGFVNGLEAVLGYFWLSQLEPVWGLLGLPIERDLYWAPKSLAEVMTEVRHDRVF